MAFSCSTKKETEKIGTGKVTTKGQEKGETN